MPRALQHPLDAGHARGHAGAPKKCGSMSPRAFVAKRDSSVAKTASPTEPPVWRSSEFSPVASESRCRGIELSAIVVSGMKRQLNATP